MPIIMFETTSIEGKVTSKHIPWDAEIRFDRPDITLIVSERSDNNVEIDFRFTALGKTVVKIEGTLIYETDAEFSSESTMPENIKQEIMTVIANICLPDATNIARLLRKPAPLRAQKKYFKPRTSEFCFRSIETRRFVKLDERVGQVKVEHNSNVTLVSEINDKEVNIEFRFTTNFTGIGVIKMDGSFIYECNATEVAKNWFSTGNMPVDMATEVHQTILAYCIPEVAAIAHNIHLPSAIPLPEVKFTQKPQPPGRSIGAEVA